MVDVNAPENVVPNEERSAGSHVSHGGFVSSFISLLFWTVISCTLLWNWDGFWQTEITVLNKAQKEYFPSKYQEEQLKLSRVINNKIIEDIQKQLVHSEEKAKLKLEQIIAERDVAVQQMILSKDQLATYLEVENLKCRYFDTSLRMGESLILTGTFIQYCSPAQETG